MARIAVNSSHPIRLRYSKSQVCSDAANDGPQNNKDLDYTALLGLPLHQELKGQQLTKELCDLHSFPIPCNLHHNIQFLGQLDEDTSTLNELAKHRPESFVR